MYMKRETMNTPITLDFYGENDEKETTYTVPRVKTKILKAAIHLGREINDPKTMDEAQVNSLLDFIVDLFGNKFTREDLEEKTDLFECFSVLGMVFSRAGSLTSQFARANPTVPLSKKK